MKTSIELSSFQGFVLENQYGPNLRTYTILGGLHFYDSKVHILKLQ